MERGNDEEANDGTAGKQAPWTLHLHEHPSEIDATAWDALLHSQPEATPFMRHAYLSALHESGSATPETGWNPRFATVSDGGGMLAAACALYLKAHSYGEYVFDWAWADAWERAGGRYYPKLLSAVPFTPVPGARLMARDATARSILLKALEQLTRDQGLSSAHLLFIDEADRDAATQAGWLLRSTVQFHWRNRAPAPYVDFDEFVSSLHRDKRRKIRQERRYVHEAGVRFEARVGHEIRTADWDFFYRCYTATYQAHRSTPYLTRDFFARMADAMPEHWLLFVAKLNGQPIAASLVALDQARGHAYGRYWGQLPGTPAVNCLHFEACYYQPLSWCIAQGLHRFEGGAQGEHKMARGLMPVRTHSAHWLADTRFAAAVGRYLEREDQGIAAYVNELDERNPFKETVTP